MNRSAAIDSLKSLDHASEGSKTTGMSTDDPQPVHLRRINPDQNMWRFYRLAIQPTLFGGASLVRDWGRIGSRGQSLMETFDTSDDAGVAMPRKNCSTTSNASSIRRKVGIRHWDGSAR